MFVVRKYKCIHKHFPYLTAMKSLLFSLFLFVLFSLTLSAQFVDDFSGPAVNSQADWQGDLTLFRVSENQLQLYDQQGLGNATIFAEAPTSLAAATTWRFKVQLDFSPSTSNFARIYLGANSSNLLSANAYYLQVGGISGGDDALVLYRQDGTDDRQQILSGQIGAVGGSTVLANVQITRTTDGIWTLEADYSGGTDFQMEDTAIDNDYNQLTYFGIACKYTSTRSELFYFDDLFVDPLYEDSTPPGLDTVFADSRNSIQVRFSEPIGPNAFQAGRYVIAPNVGSPTIALSVPGQDNGVQLILNNALQNLQNYTLTINGVEDSYGNAAATLSADFSVLVPDEPAENDLLLTEVLFNQQTGAKDFIEIYNQSDKVINLLGLTIKNALKVSGTTEKTIKDDFLMLPNTYVAITADVADLRNRYPLPDTAILFEADLPTLDADEGNVSLVYNDLVLQSFDYSEDLHSPLLENDKGVSLERISFLLSENDPQNWVSAAQATGFATPGYANSQVTSGQVKEGNIFELENKRFSPDGDSFEDLLILNYQTEKNGYLANIKVFDAAGRFIKDLSRNESLASRGLITWDGSDKEGTKARTGVYLLWIEIFTPEGDKQIEKLPCVLASKL